MPDRKKWNDFYSCDHLTIKTMEDKLSTDVMVNVPGVETVHLTVDKKGNVAVKATTDEGAIY